MKLAAANIPFENSSTAFGALHPYGQSNILKIVNTTILVRKSTEKVFEQHRSVFLHKSSCILAIYKDIYIELTKISTAITTQKYYFTVEGNNLLTSSSLNGMVSPGSDYSKKEQIEFISDTEMTLTTTGSSTKDIYTYKKIQ